MSLLVHRVHAWSLKFVFICRHLIPLGDAGYSIRFQHSAARINLIQIGKRTLMKLILERQSWHSDRNGEQYQKLKICFVVFLRIQKVKARILCVIRKQSLENTCADWLQIVFPWLDRNTKLAWAVDLMMARAKRIYILTIKVNRLFFFFSSRCFLKETENMFSVFLSSYINTRESLGELEKATAFLVLPNFHSCFYNSKETRYMFSISYYKMFD